jgi:hypothetical protein
MAIANHAIATLSQQWRAECSRLIILMPLYPKIVSDPATPKRCSLNDRNGWCCLNCDEA